MAAETNDPTASAAIQHRAPLNYIGAEAVTLAADWTPTLTDSQGNALKPRALWIGGAGAVKVDFIDGTTGILLSGIPAGTRLPIAISKVYSTVNGTTATLIIALY